MIEYQARVLVSSRLGILWVCASSRSPVGWVFNGWFAQLPDCVDDESLVASVMAARAASPARVPAPDFRSGPPIMAAVYAAAGVKSNRQFQKHATLVRIDFGDDGSVEVVSSHRDGAGYSSDPADIQRLETVDVDSLGRAIRDGLARST
jgi:hypothetical protein